MTFEPIADRTRAKSLETTAIACVHQLTNAYLQTILKAQAEIENIQLTARMDELENERLRAQINRLEAIYQGVDL